VTLTDRGPGGVARRIGELHASEPLRLERGGLDVQVNETSGDLHPADVPEPGVFPQQCRVLTADRRSETHLASALREFLARDHAHVHAPVEDRGARTDPRGGGRQHNLKPSLLEVDETGLVLAGSLETAGGLAPDPGMQSM